MDLGNPGVRQPGLWPSATEGGSGLATLLFQAPLGKGRRGGKLWAPLLPFAEAESQPPCPAPALQFCQVQPQQVDDSLHDHFSHQLPKFQFIRGIFQKPTCLGTRRLSCPPLPGTDWEVVTSGSILPMISMCLLKKQFTSK